MTLLEQHFEDLKKEPRCSLATIERKPSGANLITIPNFKMPPGWNRDIVTIRFLAPPAYPIAQPDCFWIDPTGVRLANGMTPQNTNDQNPIPEHGPAGTWFSWHLQSWNPNADSLITFFNVIMQRLRPPR